MTSLTPSTATAMSAVSTRSCCTSASACADVMPLFATSCHATRIAADCARWRVKYPASASCCVITPTPAPDESPTISSRNSAPLPTTPRRGPLASGSSGARRRVRTACATRTGASASFSASDMSSGSRELGEVGLALLEERAERFLRLRARQALGKHRPFGGDRLEHLRGTGATHQLLRLAHGPRRQCVEALCHAPCMVDELIGRQHRIG